MNNVNSASYQNHVDFSSTKRIIDLDKKIHEDENKEIKDAKQEFEKLWEELDHLKNQLENEQVVSQYCDVLYKMLKLSKKGIKYASKASESIPEDYSTRFENYINGLSKSAKHYSRVAKLLQTCMFGLEFTRLKKMELNLEKQKELLKDLKEVLNKTAPKGQNSPLIDQLRNEQQEDSADQDDSPLISDSFVQNICTPSTIIEHTSNYGRIKAQVEKLQNTVDELQKEVDNGYKKWQGKTLPTVISATSVCLKVMKGFMDVKAQTYLGYVIACLGIVGDLFKGVKSFDKLVAARTLWYDLNEQKKEIDNNIREDKKYPELNGTLVKNRNLAAKNGDKALEQKLDAQITILKTKKAYLENVRIKNLNSKLAFLWVDFLISASSILGTVGAFFVATSAIAGVLSTFALWLTLASFLVTAITYFKKNPINAQDNPQKKELQEAIKKAESISKIQLELSVLSKIDSPDEKTRNRMTELNEKFITEIRIIEEKYLKGQEATQNNNLSQHVLALQALRTKIEKEEEEERLAMGIGLSDKNEYKAWTLQLAAWLENDDLKKTIGEMLNIDNFKGLEAQQIQDFIFA